MARSGAQRRGNMALGHRGRPVKGTWFARGPDQKNRTPPIVIPPANDQMMIAAERHGRTSETMDKFAAIVARRRKEIPPWCGMPPWLFEFEAG